MTPLQRLNPRLHLAAAIGWSVFAVVTLAALVAATVAANTSEARIRADTEQLLAEIATQVRDALSLSLETRRSLLQATAAQHVAVAQQDPAAARRALEAVQAAFPELVWVGLINERGRVVAGTQGEHEGADTTTTALFQQGRLRPYVTELHTGLGGAPAMAAAAPARPQLMDFAVPLNAQAGQLSGVVAAHLDWAWVERVLGKFQDALNRRRDVQVWMASRDGRVLIGPPQWLGRQALEGSDLSEGGRFLVVARTQLRLADGLGLGWTAIVRQRTEQALQPVRLARRSAFLTVFGAGLLAATLAALLTRMLLRRLSALARDAEDVRRGALSNLQPLAGADEVSRIGATLALTVGHLQAEKRALQTLNSELDHRVAERTRRIERMGEEARHAAVTRERLRLARDLHDTLAHSLMALLTQIRLVRKLRLRMQDAELDAELGRAEEVATSGLTEARAAIRQMRDNGVQDTGLGPALQDLARRFSERCGVGVEVDLDPSHASAADQRAETLFRIVEEALRNIERHADAHAVRITWHGSEDDPAGVLTIQDDGVGFEVDRPRPDHFGLLGMREQAVLIGAQLSVSSRQGAGTCIQLRFGP